MYNFGLFECSRDHVAQGSKHEVARVVLLGKDTRYKNLYYGFSVHIEAHIGMA